MAGMMKRLSARKSKRFEFDGFEQGDPSSNYDLLECLGEGTYGSVYIAEDRKGKRTVALKIVPIDDDEEEIQQEIDIMRMSTCPFIVQLYSAWTSLDGKQVWMGMEICEGGSVNDLMFVTDKTMAEIQIREVVACATLGLAYLHERLVIHRDIKCGNILLTDSGHVKLADFGVSAMLQSRFERCHTAIGAPYWMAPEVISEEGYDGRADIWSLGITCIEMAEARPPNSHIHPMRALFLIPNQAPPTLADDAQWSKDFVGFVRACLTKEHDARPSAQATLGHKFIAKTAKKMQNNGGVSKIIEKLVRAAMPAIAAFRNLDSDDDSETHSVADPRDATLEEPQRLKKPAGKPEPGRSQTFFELPDNKPGGSGQSTKLRDLFKPSPTGNAAKAKKEERKKEEAAAKRSSRRSSSASTGSAKPSRISRLLGSGTSKQQPPAPLEPVAPAAGAAAGAAKPRASHATSPARKTMRADSAGSGGGGGALPSPRRAVHSERHIQPIRPPQPVREELRQQRRTLKKTSKRAGRGSAAHVPLPPPQPPQQRDAPTMLLKADQKEMDFEQLRKILKPSAQLTEEEGDVPLAEDGEGQNPEEHLADHFGATVMTKQFITLLKTAKKRDPTLFEILEAVSDPQEAMEMAVAALRIAAGKKVIRRADVASDDDDAA